VITIGRQEIEVEALTKMHALTTTYARRVSIDQVQLESRNPPESVPESCDDVNQAQQEREKLLNEARRDYDKVISLAEGEKDPRIREAGGGRLERSNEAEGDAARFRTLQTGVEKDLDMGKLLPIQKGRRLVEQEIVAAAAESIRIQGFVPLARGAPAAPHTWRPVGLARSPGTIRVTPFDTVPTGRLAPDPRRGSRQAARRLPVPRASGATLAGNGMSTRVTATPEPTQNHLLAMLPSETRERLFPHLALTELPLGAVLCEAGHSTESVHFPTDCIVSLLYVMESGASAEISVVGNEGMVGIALFMGGESTTSRALVQGAGHGDRLSRRRVKDEIARHGDLMHLMLRYTRALITQMAQTAVCNRHYSIDQQLCRWLLLSLDRLSGNQLVMTQEPIANTLGVRRSSVSVAAAAMQRNDLIAYSRGEIALLDRAALERVSCPCYEAEKADYRHLLG